MNIKKNFLPSIIIITSTVFCLLFFHTSPLVRLWRGYVEVSVPKDIPEQKVVGILASSGCSGIIHLSEQKTPLLSKYAPVGYDFISSDANGYIQKRKRLFFDRNTEYKIYYIPEAYKKNVQEAVPVISHNFSCPVESDSVASIPLLAPLISLLFFLFLLTAAENKLLFTTISLLPVFFSFCFPYYTNAAAVCLFIYGLYLLQKYWNRDGFEKILRYKKIILVFILFPVLITFLTSKSSCLFFVLTGISSFSVIVTAKCLKHKKLSSKTMQFTNIIPSQMIPVFGTKSIRMTAVCSGGIFLLLVALSGFNGIIKNSGTGGLSLPSVKGYTSCESFPNISDYVLWYWNTVTFPYRSLNTVHDFSKKPVKGESVIISTFTQTESDIEEKDRPVYQFGDKFTAKAVKSIDDMRYPAVEKLMKAQGTDFSVGYLKTGNVQFNIKNSILLFVSFLIPTTVLLFLIVGRKRNARNI